jgi:ParB/RepB/Spo0J family partition protein
MNLREGVIPVGLDHFDLELERLHRAKETAVEKMARSLSQKGQLTPVIVTEHRDRYLLVDGFKRYRAAEKLSLPFLSAFVVVVDGKQVKAMLYLLNRPGSFSMIQEALLVRELVETDGLTGKEAGLLLDRHKSWISRRLAMVRRLSTEVIEALLLEQIPPGVGSSLARIPLCNQVDFAAAIQAHHLTPNEIHRVVDFYCKAPHPDIKQTILQSPRNALCVVEEKLRIGQLIFKVIEMLGAIEQMLGAERKGKIQKVKSILNGLLEET